MSNIEISAPGIGHKFELKSGKIWASQEGNGGPTVVFISGAGTVGLDYYELQKKYRPNLLPLFMIEWE